MFFEFESSEFLDASKSSEKFIPLNENFTEFGIEKLVDKNSMFHLGFFGDHVKIEPGQLERRQFFFSFRSIS